MALEFGTLTEVEGEGNPYTYTMTATVDAGDNGLICWSAGEVDNTGSWDMTIREDNASGTIISKFGTSGVGIASTIDRDLTANIGWIFGLSPGSHDIWFNLSGLPSGYLFYAACQSVSWGTDSPTVNATTTVEDEQTTATLTDSPSRDNGDAIFGLLVVQDDDSVTVVTGNTQTTNSAVRRGPAGFGIGFGYRNSTSDSDTTAFGFTTDINEDKLMIYAIFDAAASGGNAIIGARQRMHNALRQPLRG